MREKHNHGENLPVSIFKVLWWKLRGKITTWSFIKGMLKSKPMMSDIRFKE